MNRKKIYPDEIVLIVCYTLYIYFNNFKEQKKPNDYYNNEFLKDSLFSEM